MNPNEESRLCDKCRATPVGRFVFVTTSGESTYFCDDCARIEDPYWAEALDATCYYCGAPAAAGGYDPFSRFTGEAGRNYWMCNSCFGEAYAFVTTKLEEASSGNEYDDKARDLNNLRTATDAHMQAFVSERDR
jgi:hypothetical protein